MTLILSRKLVVAASTALLLAGCAVGAARGQTVAPDAPRRVIVVNGEGQIAAAPDQARLVAGVLTQAMTAAAALDDNTRAMNTVFAALRRLGIPDTKIRTSNFSLTPQYPPFRPDAPEMRDIAGYQVSNQVTVIVDDVSKVGAILDTLIRSGANQSGGVAFEIADTGTLAEQARRAAVADAIAKARTLADAAGVALGAILSIQEGGVSTGGPEPRIFAAAVGTPPPVSAGEQTVSVSVTVTYAIR
jgi:uncharacterized protein